MEEEMIELSDEQINALRQADQDGYPAADNDPIMLPLVGIGMVTIEVKNGVPLYRTTAEGHMTLESI